MCLFNSTTRVQTSSVSPPRKRRSVPLARGPAETAGSPEPHRRGGGRLRFGEAEPGAAAEPSAFAHPGGRRREVVEGASLCLDARFLPVVVFLVDYFLFFFLGKSHSPPGSAFPDDIQISPFFSSIQRSTLLKCGSPLCCPQNTHCSRQECRF